MFHQSQIIVTGPNSFSQLEKEEMSAQPRNPSSMLILSEDIQIPDRKQEDASVIDKSAISQGKHYEKIVELVDQIDSLRYEAKKLNRDHLKKK